MSVSVAILPHTMMGKDEYYSYEDIDEVDEMDSENDSIEEYSQYSESLSRCSLDEWLSTIAEETSFDLRTRKSLDSLSLASYFDSSVDVVDDDADSDAVSDDDADEEIDSLKGVQRRLEMLKKRLDRFTGMSESEDESLDSDCEDSYSDEKELESPTV